MFKIRFETLNVVSYNNKTIAVVKANVYRNGELFDSFVTKGSTICRNNDKFNENYGQRIAILKAKRLAFANIRSSMQEIYKQYSGFVDDVQEVIKRCAVFKYEINNKLELY